MKKAEKIKDIFLSLENHVPQEYKKYNRIMYDDYCHNYYYKKIIVEYDKNVENYWIFNLFVVDYGKPHYGILSIPIVFNNIEETILKGLKSMFPMNYHVYHMKLEDIKNHDKIKTYIGLKPNK